MLYFFTITHTQKYMLLVWCLHMFIVLVTVILYILHYMWLLYYAIYVILYRVAQKKKTSNLYYATLLQQFTIIRKETD